MASRRMLVVVPTRGRPGNAEAVIEAWVATGAPDVADLLLGWDADDQEAAGYRALAAAAKAWDGGAWVHGVEAPLWRPLVPKLNALAASWCSRWDVIGFAGDDHLPRTDGWATAYLERLDGMGTGVVSSPDGYRADDLPTQWVMTSDIVRRLGCMVPAPVEHLYCDRAVRDLAKEAGCYSWAPDVLIEHMHPDAGKAASDGQYRRVNSAAQYAGDRQAYRRWRRTGLAGDAAAVRALMS